MGYTTGISNKMFCLYSVSKNSKIIQTCMFSEIVRPKMGLIDPSPLIGHWGNMKGKFLKNIKKSSQKP